MLRFIAVTIFIALPLLIATITHRTKLHANHQPQRRWMRCCICCSYQNTSSSHCPNHERPVCLLEASQRQQRRIVYHIGYLWQYPHLKAHQHAFIAFVMRLEDMTGDAWSTHAAITVFEQIGPRYLQKFVEFILGIEEATGKRFDANDLIEQFLTSERMEEDEEKVAQN